jgi:hypothetical protein
VIYLFFFIFIHKDIMKIIITETQLKQIMNEVGGYDDKDTMLSHSGTLYGEIEVIVSNLIEKLNYILKGMYDKTMTKNQLIKYLEFYNSLIIDNIGRLNQLIGEVFLDDDFYNIIEKFIGALKELSEYLILLTGSEIRSFDKFAPKKLSFGLINDMTMEDVRIYLVKKLKEIENDFLGMRNMFDDVERRYYGRFEN